jgi:hypothetical protein
MGRIIYKARSVSHVYLWVTIGICKIPATGAAASSGRSAPNPAMKQAHSMHADLSAFAEACGGEVDGILGVEQLSVTIDLKPSSPSGTSVVVALGRGITYAACADFKTKLYSEHFVHPCFS